MKFIFLFVLFLVLGSPAVDAQDVTEESSAEATEAKRGDSGEAKRLDRGRDGEHRKGEGEELTEEEDEKMRRLMRAVWDDPAVVQSRQEVSTASENMRRVLREKIVERDPQAVELLEKVRHRFGPGGDKPSRGGGPPAPHGGRGDGLGDVFQYMAKPSFYNSFTEEERTIYDEAFRAALGTSALKEVANQLSDLRESSEELRRERIKLFGKSRKLLWDAMIEADPRVKALEKKRGLDWSGSRPDSGNRPPREGERGPKNK